MVDLVLVDGKARGIVVRNLVTGRMERHEAHAVVLATGGYGNVFFLSTNAMSSNVSAAWLAYKKGACFANPCFTQIHPTCIPVHGTYQSKLTLMSESLRNDGRVWVPRSRKATIGRPEDIRKPNGTITWKENTPVSATWCPGTWPPAMPRNNVTWARVWATPAWPYTWISGTPSSGTAKTSSARNTATFSRCTNGSRPRIRIKPP